jgi:hypothetical protein
VNISQSLDFGGNLAGFHLLHQNLAVTFSLGGIGGRKIGANFGKGTVAIDKPAVCFPLFLRSSSDVRQLF